MKKVAILDYNEKIDSIYDFDLVLTKNGEWFHIDWNNISGTFGTIDSSLLGDFLIKEMEFEKLNKI